MEDYEPGLISPDKSKKEVIRELLQRSVKKSAHKEREYSPVKEFRTS